MVEGAETGQWPGARDIAGRTWAKLLFVVILVGLGLIQGYHLADVPDTPVAYEQGRLVATDTLKNALDTLRSQASAFGSNLSVVENRQDFTKNMINTLQTGAANLTLADMNEEAANLLALQTRQSLSSSSLSLASQADQSVLQLIR